MCELTISEYNKIYNTNLPDNHHELTIKELNLELNNNMNISSNPPIIWLTGLPQSGKSTILAEFDKILEEQYIGSFIIDNDHIQTSFCLDLITNAADCLDKVRIVAEVAKIASYSGCIVLTTAINPFLSSRLIAKNILGDDYVEVFVNCPLIKCVERDTKDLYHGALLGGTDISYEQPLEPHLIVDSGNESAKECAQQIFDFIRNRL